MKYSINEIKNLISPIAEKYEIPAVYLFGSYARASASENSDVDILIKRTGSKIKSLFDLGSFYDELETALKIPIDLITEESLTQEQNELTRKLLLPSLMAERVKIYENF